MKLKPDNDQPTGGGAVDMAEMLVKFDADIAARQSVLDRSGREHTAGSRGAVPLLAREPQRDWHGYALGADLFAYGLTGRDAHALMAFRSLPLDAALRMLVAAYEEMPDGCLGDLLPIVVDRHRDRLEPQGWLISWQRRWRRYQTDLASWLAQPDDLKLGSWRTMPMTERQRELVRETATMLKCIIPEGLSRGGAADWLDANGANLSFRVGE